MKSPFIVIAILIYSLMALSSCDPVCNDPNSLSYGHIGGCVAGSVNDIIGTYTGTLRDSSGGGVHQYAVQMGVTKVNQSIVSVQLVSSSAPFTGFHAMVIGIDSGYALEVIVDSTVTGAAPIYGRTTDGSYVKSAKQLSFYVEANQYTAASYEVFTGTKQ